MSGDTDHIVRMKVANTMSTLYGVGRVDMSCQQQGAIYRQVTDSLQNISLLNVRHYLSYSKVFESIQMYVMVFLPAG